MEREQCRMCGKTLQLSDLLDISLELQNMIDYHCRINLSLLDVRLPNKLCYDCNYTIENFAKFTEDARITQMKFSALINDIKIEIEDLPALIEDSKVLNLFVDEPKIEIDPDESTEPKLSKRRKKASEIVQNSNEGSEFDDSSSDSDYEGNKYYKRKRPIKHRRVRMKRKKSSSIGEDENEILQEVPQSDRNKNGTIKKKSLVLYEGKTWNDLNIGCVECDQFTNGPFELRQHHFKYHSLDTQFRCSECVHENDVNFSYFYQFLNHYPEHQKHLKFCCVICSEMFWNTRSLNQHYESSHEKTDRTALFHCIRCGQYFRKSFDLINHESRVHNIESIQPVEIDSTKVASLTMEDIFEEEIKCDSFEQKSPFNLLEDQKNSDGTVTVECKERFSECMWNNIAIYQCTHCGIQSSTIYQLYEHYNAEHSETKNSFVCKSCPEHKTFLNLESYVNHTFTIHHEHLRYFCFICFNGYWNYKTLYHHYKTEHEDYKAFICLYCGKYHKSVYDIRHHKEVHSTKGDKLKQSRNFTCSICPKSFTRQNQLQRHLDTHVKNENKVWICETCGKSFNAKSTLINHAMVHQTDKPFVCTTCGEGFKNKYKLKHHKGIHTGERNFGCEICGQRFRAKGTLKGHILTHTGERPFSMYLN
ncbi:hypothetical protein ACKWTF_007874 [Chironomus riparius]